MTYSVIHKYRFKFSVEKMCQMLGVSRSGYYTWAARPESQRKKENNELLEKIKKVHKISRETYGSPRVTYALKNEGISSARTE